MRHLSGWAQFDGQVNRLALDLAKPDGIVVTRSLSRLPRDLLRVPLLKDTLSEDFVFYYEHNEDRLSLTGSLRRIAYEHDLNWSDRLLQEVLDQPAEIAFWRDAKGAAEYTLTVITRDTLARLVQEAATFALKDKQLTRAGEIAVGGDSVPLLVLSYGRDRNLLIASRGNRVAILSDPGMLLASPNKVDDKAATVLARLLSANANDQGLLRREFSLDNADLDHRLVVSARFLSFGYQRFFPAVEALRFDFGRGQWSTAVRLASGTSLQPAASSRALPAGPAACAWLPAALPANLIPASAQGAPTSLPRLAGTAAACWYDESSLHTPLFVAELAAEADAVTDKALGELYAWMVKGTRVDDVSRQGTVQWQNQTPARYGPYGGDGQPAYYKPTFARKGRLLLFSPDDQLVGRALDVLERRYPSIADAMPVRQGSVPLATFTPAAMASLSRAAVFEVLDNQAALHDAAETHLVPRLEALAKYPAYRLMLPASGTNGGWQKVNWEALAANP
ncbi:DUF2138 family protein [Azonexus sp.]|uniref:DUF2138 family protein n=1 Tax=Azonexus sp. TaxID=1872668 RepID=UPI0035B2890D